MTYYDGYGYNFYNGAYGYYEYSRPPVNNSGPPWDITTFFTFLGTFVGVLIIFIIIYYKVLTWQEDPEEEAKKEKTAFKEKMSQGLQKIENE